jgi:hypothetical protein
VKQKPESESEPDITDFKPIQEEEEADQEMKSDIDDFDFKPT